MLTLTKTAVTPLLHPTPLLAPSHLTFSIRLHLALHLALPSKISLEASIGERLRKAVENVLEMAVLMTEGEQGTSRGWKSVIISVLVCFPCLSFSLACIQLSRSGEWQRKTLTCLSERRDQTHA